MKPTSPNRLASCLRDYFADPLPRLRGMSPHTIHSYRDSLVLLLHFVASDRKVEVCGLDLDDIQPDRVLAFLSHLEKDRENSVTTRNVRLAAIHAFFRYVGAHHPDQIERAQRILGVPFKRADQRVIEYLDRTEIEAVLAGVDRSIVVRYILAKHVDRARPKVVTLGRKRLHPHSMRHSTAVALLKSGVGSVHHRPVAWTRQPNDDESIRHHRPRHEA